MVELPRPASGPFRWPGGHEPCGSSNSVRFVGEQVFILRGLVNGRLRTGKLIKPNQHIAQRVGKLLKTNSKNRSHIPLKVTYNVRT
jgi:hypothetical protein